MSRTIFERIVAREIPARIVFEDEDLWFHHGVRSITPARAGHKPQGPGGILGEDHTAGAAPGFSERRKRRLRRVGVAVSRPGLGLTTTGQGWGHSSGGGLSNAM